MNDKQRFDGLYSAVLADVLDTLGYRDQSLGTAIRACTPARRVAGRVLTVRARPIDHDPPEPYKLEMAAIEMAEAGDVLVVDAGHDKTCGFWGELLTTACVAKGVNGIVMSACTRDLWALADTGFPVFGIGSSPADSRGRLDVVAVAESIRIDGVAIESGDWVLGDVDGVVVIPQAVADEAIALAREKVSGENLVRAELASGASVSSVFRKYGIL